MKLKYIRNDFLYLSESFTAFDFCDAFFDLCDLMQRSSQMYFSLECISFYLTVKDIFVNDLIFHIVITKLSAFDSSSANFTENFIALEQSDH